MGNPYPESNRYASYTTDKGALRAQKEMKAKGFRTVVVEDIRGGSDLFFSSASERKKYVKSITLKPKVTVSSEKVVLVKSGKEKLTNGKRVKICTPSGLSLGGGVVRDRRGQHIRM
jgi:hypothetical protein